MVARLSIALWQLDLRYIYVADYARRGASPLYRIAGLWGGPDGSLMLLSSMFAVGVVIAGRHWELAARAGSVTLAMLTLTMVTIANPFRQLDVPAIDGGGTAADS